MNRLHLYILLGGCFLLSSLWPAQAAADSLRAIKTVVIDPGHGGINNGTTSAGGVLEKDQALRIAYLVRQRLAKDFPDLKVVLTRTLDISLSLPERLAIAHQEGADLFFSLHLNAAPNKQATGMEVFYLRHDKATPMLPDQGGTWGKDFTPPAPQDTSLPMPAGSALPALMEDLRKGRAHRDSGLMAEILLDELGRACPGRQIRGVRQDNFGVLRGARMPAVVVELGFLSNTAEARWLVRPETHTRFGRAISRTIKRVDEVMVRKNYLQDTSP